MPSNDFNEKVLETISKIPVGKVSTYGAIAQHCGLKSGARMVGYILNSQKNNSEMPCHRVLNRNGELTGKLNFTTPDQMQELLESEGVVVTNDRVDLNKYFWKPE